MNSLYFHRLKPAPAAAFKAKYQGEFMNSLYFFNVKRYLSAGFRRSGGVSSYYIYKFEFASLPACLLVNQIKY